MHPVLGVDCDGYYDDYGDYYDKQDGYDDDEKDDGYGHYYYYYYCIRNAIKNLRFFLGLSCFSIRLMTSRLVT